MVCFHEINSTVCLCRHIKLILQAIFLPVSIFSDSLLVYSANRILSVTNVTYVIWDTQRWSTKIHRFFYTHLMADSMGKKGSYTYFLGTRTRASTVLIFNVHYEIVRDSKIQGKVSD